MGSKRAMAVSGVETISGFAVSICSIVACMVVGAFLFGRRGGSFCCCYLDVTLRIGMVIRCYFESGSISFRICLATPCRMITPAPNRIASQPAVVIDHHVATLSIQTIKNDKQINTAMIAAMHRYPCFAVTFGLSSISVHLNIGQLFRSSFRF